MGLLSGLGKVLGVAGTIGGFIPGLGGAGKILSAGGGLLAGAERGGKADKIQNQRKGLADERYSAMAPARSRLAALIGQSRPQARDLSSIFADPGNPYARRAPRPSPLAVQGNTATPMPLPMTRPRRASLLAAQQPSVGFDRETAVY